MRLGFFFCPVSLKISNCMNLLTVWVKRSCRLGLQSEWRDFLDARGVLSAEDTLNTSPLSHVVALSFAQVCVHPPAIQVWPFFEGGGCRCLQLSVR